MKATEKEERALDALITRELLKHDDPSEIMEKDIKSFLEDSSSLSSAEIQMLERLDPLSHLSVDGGESDKILQFSETTPHDCYEPELMAAARNQDEDITDKNVRDAIAEKRREAIGRARLKRQQEPPEEDD